MNKSFLRAALLIAGFTIIFGCVKDTPDEPPFSNVPFDPEKVLNIAQIKSIFTDSAGVYTFSDNYSLFATVGMDELSGNIYRSVFVQDATGGIQLNLLYPGGLYLGDSIRIVLNGYTLDEYRGLFQINNIDQGKSIVKIMNKRFIEPRVLTIQELTSQIYEYQSTVIKLVDVQFAYAELGQTYADSVNKIDINRTIEQCDGASMIVRSSGYAKFANHILPDGKGTIIAIATVFESGSTVTPQLVIRAENEVQLTGERCGGGGTIDPVTEVAEYFNSAQNNTDIVIEGWSNIPAAGNRRWQGKEFDGNIYAQATGYNSGLADMEVWMITPPVINTSGDKVLNFNSGMAFWAHTVTNPITVLASTDFDGVNVANATWTELSANFPNSSSGNYNWIPSGQISLAEFVGNVSVAFKYKGSGTESTSITIDDVVISGGGGPGVVVVEEGFDDGWNGWEPVSVAGAQVWSRDNTAGPDGSACAQMSGYDIGYNINNDWLVSPPLDLGGYNSASLEFASARNFDGEDIRVKVTANYTGNPATTTWTTLTATLSTGGFNWTHSGVVNLSAFNSNGVRVAFEYNSSSTNGATWRVDNIVIKAQ
jgi:hypothetical protein